ncbi:hypothetical protein A3D77_01580 [Candidatus Gottesmanbacteria bacterium RIFCSPHIGHO2_02_FULL_39_11]|uniref:Yip1 domain-containing protein n=1 Tax=Candidatus Gottesmanbacteria bacterium RIFCSPHIGHO2_02_FULL_39_11 TaxID=1798382 RepID=A0A1F5ZT98_9BACT|nr:MAG: hypothetical protein A3D77_01580 [Candidatus Gottesmanbacteria bacterium RIFCSPHIGHO2_02_FULL_39_11]
MSFLKTSWGCFNRPYETYRKISSGSFNLLSTFFIFFFVCVYFAWESLIRTPFRSPYVLTYNFGLSFLAAATGFSLIVGILYFLGEKTHEKISLERVVILWSYSLLPTVIWFFSTSLIYMILPPPRTLSVWGKGFSIVFISFSIALLGWKIILYYLTLRFGLRISLKKILTVSFVVIPIIAIYSLGMYYLRIFRIPFI